MLSYICDAVCDKLSIKMGNTANGKFTMRLYCPPSRICAAIFLTKHIIPQMRQFSCLPYMAPSDCFLFIKFQRNLKRQNI